MIQGWMVVRREYHVDDRFWVCIDREDAVSIARDVSAYWKRQYEDITDDIDRTCYGEAIFSFVIEDGVYVFVLPQNVREVGEREEVG